jgi:hypothetical protein
MLDTIPFFPYGFFSADFFKVLEVADYLRVLVLVGVI